MAESKWIDISYPLSQDMIYWPDDPIPPNIDLIYTPTEERPVTMIQMNINTHHGTHIDAPRHFRPDGACVDEMPLETIMGPARIIGIKDTESIKPGELEKHNIQAGERILFKTVNSSYLPARQICQGFRMYL